MSTELLPWLDVVIALLRGFDELSSMLGPPVAARRRASGVAGSHFHAGCNPGSERRFLRGNASTRIARNIGLCQMRLHHLYSRNGCLLARNR